MTYFLKSIDFRLLVIAALAIVLLSACEGDTADDMISSPPMEEENEIITGEVTQFTNPGGFCPLCGSIKFTTTQEVSVQMRVVGKNGSESDVVHHFDELSTDFGLPILGFYPDHRNEVEFTFLDANGQEVGNYSTTFRTGSLIDDLPDIQLNVAEPEALAPGMTLVNHFGYSSRSFPQEAFIFDAFGDIRWYLDYSRHDQLGNLFFDAGMIKLQNGNLCFGDAASGAIYEVDMLGIIQKRWPLDKYRFHHVVFEKPNGNILATVTNTTIPTVEDFIIEIDRTSGRIIKEIDIRQTLDRFRRVWDTDLADISIDWLHANGLSYDDSDQGIVISGRTQGVFKIADNNDLVWILAPHRGWRTSGSGQLLSDFLLQPLDRNGEPITDPGVLEGSKNHPDFEWQWYQHSPVVLPNGNVMVFDNGDNRNYVSHNSTSNRYSRAVEYEIDAENMTVRQVWTYGKERGAETYSRITSKVDYLADSDNVIFAPGSGFENGRHVGKVLEIDKTTGEVLLEAAIYPPRANFGITFHSVYRVGLYD